MNGIDGLLLLVVGLGLVAGWRQGALRATTSLLALAASLIFALWAYPHGAAWIERQDALWEGEWRVWTAPLAFIAAFVALRVALGVLFGRLLRALPERVHGHAANRAVGLVPGLGMGLVDALVVAIFLVSLPWSDTVSRAARESPLVQHFAGPADWLESRLGPIFDPAVEKTLTRLVVQPESAEAIALPFKTATGTARPDLEAKMLALVNAERAEAGLAALAPDPEATEVARAHARDMLARGYFSHLAPDGASPFDRLRRANVGFRSAGENLALARTLPMAHAGLMKSPGHRANILRPAFGRLGVGVIDAGRHGLMVAQVFRN